MTLENLLKIADFVNKKARELVPYSSNRPDERRQSFHRVFWLDVMRARNDQDFSRQKILQWRMNLREDKVNSGYENRRVTQTFFNAPSAQPTLAQWNDYIRALPNRFYKEFHKDGAKMTTVEKIESCAKNAVKFGMGNCGEYSRLIVSMLLEYPKEGLTRLGLPALPKNKKISIELVSFSAHGSAHSFVVCNRAVGSDLKRMSTWGEQAFIIDSWFNEIIVVADHIGKKASTSPCFARVAPWEAEFFSIYDYLGYIGDGHSLRWQINRTAKKEPLNLRDWPAFYAGEEKENVPWVEGTIEHTQRESCLDTVLNFFSHCCDKVSTSSVFNLKIPLLRK